MEINKVDSLVIKYVLKFPQSWEMDDFITYDFFRPYTFKQLGYINKTPQINLRQLFEHNVEPMLSSKLISGKADILLDMMYCLHFIRPPFDILYYPLDEYFLVSNISQIGIYTELIKQDIKRFKRDLSTYINCFFSEESRQLYQIIDSINQNNNINFTISNHNDIKESLQLYLHNSNFSNLFEYEIDLSKVDRFVSLLKKYNATDKNGDSRNYITTEGCFCLAQSKNQFYFSISGTYPEYDKFGKEIESYLKQYFKYNSITYCSLNNETLCFVSKDKKKQFIYYNPPLKYSDAKNIFNEKELSFLYGCCERKIFSNINNTNELVLFCKYDPCPKCVPAIKFEKNKRSKILFYSFAKNPNAFKKYLNKTEDKLIHKLELNIINII